MAGSLTSFVDDRMPLCETLSLGYANGANATGDEVIVTEVRPKYW